MKAHESKINKACKTAIVQPTETKMHVLSNFLAFRAKQQNNLMREMFPERDCSNPYKITSTPLKVCMKIEDNIRSMSDELSRTEAFTLNSSSNWQLSNFATGQLATPECEHDLLHFQVVGQEDYEKWVAFHFRKQPSAQVSFKYHRLCTFSTTKLEIQKAKRLVQERKLIEVCMKKQTIWMKLTEAQDTHQQMLELPRALVIKAGLPVKGRKHKAVQFYSTRYMDKVVKDTLPQNWVPHAAIIDGMFLLYAPPPPGTITVSENTVRTVYCPILWSWCSWSSPAIWWPWQILSVPKSLRKEEEICCWKH